MATTTNRPYGPGGARRDRLRLLLRQQEAMLRRVLTLLVDWVENGSPDAAYRTHAA